MSGIEEKKKERERGGEEILKYTDLMNALENLLSQPQKSTFKESIISLKVNDIHI